jgi:hypothetical protein
MKKALRLHEGLVSGQYSVPSTFTLADGVKYFGGDWGVDLLEVVGIVGERFFWIYWERDFLGGDFGAGDGAAREFTGVAR